MAPICSGNDHSSSERWIISTTFDNPYPICEIKQHDLIHLLVVFAYLQLVWFISVPGIHKSSWYTFANIQIRRKSIRASPAGLASCLYVLEWWPFWVNMQNLKLLKVNILSESTHNHHRFAKVVSCLMNGIRLQTNCMYWKGIQRIGKCTRGQS